jgi:hypothetical protein
VRKRDDKVWVVVIGAKAIRAKIKNLMASSSELRDQFLFQVKPPMVRGYAYTHEVIPIPVCQLTADTTQEQKIIIRAKVDLLELTERSLQMLSIRTVEA